MIYSATLMKVGPGRGRATGSAQALNPIASAVCHMIILNSRSSNMSLIKPNNNNIVYTMFGGYGLWASIS